MPNSILYRRLISDEAVRLKKPFSWNEWCINHPEVQLLIILYYLHGTIFQKTQEKLPLQDNTSDCGLMICLYGRQLLLPVPQVSIYCDGIYAK